MHLPGNSVRLPISSEPKTKEAILSFLCCPQRRISAWWVVTIRDVLSAMIGVMKLDINAYNQAISLYI